MSDQIDLSKKRNRIVLALDIFLGTIFFGECWPTEPMSSYFWRCGKTDWVVAVVNDCAVTTLRLNQLQAEIEAQPSYRSGHSK